MKHSSLPLITLLFIGFGASGCGSEVGSQDIVPTRVVGQTERVGAADLVTRRIASNFDRQGSISPDGRRMAVTNWATGNLQIRELDTDRSWDVAGNEVPYESGSTLWSQFSSSGDRVVFNWQNREGTELRVVDLESGSVQTLVRHDGYLAPVDWSSDDRAVAATLRSPSSGVQFLLIDADAGSYQTLKTFGWDQHPGSVHFSPDGRFLAYDVTATDGEELSDVYVLAVDGRQEEPVLATDAKDALLGWSRDGDGIIALSENSDSPEALFVPLRNGRRVGAPSVLARGLWNARPFEATASGSYYYTVRIAGRTAYMADVAEDEVILSANPQVLAGPTLFGVSIADWLPDGRSVILQVPEASEDDQDARLPLIVKSIETGAERITWSKPTLFYTPLARWIPGTNSVVLRARLGPLSTTALYTVDLQTGEAARLTEPRAAEEERILGYSLEVSADGGTVYFQTERPGQDGQFLYRIKAMAMNGTRERTLFEVQPGGASRPPVRAFSLNPSETTLALRLRGNIELLDLGTGRLRTVLSGVGEGAMMFGPTDRALWFVDQPSAPEEGSELKIVDIESGEVSSTGLREVRLGVDDNGYGGGIRLSPDGRKLAFTAGESRTELWIMEGVGSAGTPNGR